MKFITYIQRTLALGLFLVAATVLAAGPGYRIEVDGLACPFCAYGIEKKLSAIVGVERLETNIEDGSVRVTLQDGVQSLDEAVVREAVEAAGFSLRKIERLSPAPPGMPEEGAK
ncbi:heavy-metal-associated domain-containing protein [Pseudomonas aeruginosa]|uniref:heavy-metal-associated domain-containing protein n=1 Tax=Pseudomonas aeruginosa TaxID=287 RepID=UPI000EAC71B3|nr:heavy-metal-associated domain-containing protein [Pseudomonas aeruginosa]ELV1374432.1 heavy-metal-associated domain-containing protein [Pseudomonas aeruginosa]MCX3418233.1 heavy-metal-associated domain-containing protein [Pseudomonas aeruginosa]MDE9770656.1 heavy-metal-associated domain-containing protein [Pseudomonas aeruginosa]TSC48403.1 heavy-metal-associated domain-containing protein [Pseudomonas aeruginosa]HBO3125468.1 heavy-metal-associated domain-containing protein [Pseudomonas aerug